MPNTNTSQPQTNKLRLPPNIIALGLVSFFNDASSEIIYPLLPLFLTGRFGASAQLIGLIEGIAESSSSLLKFPTGWLSDRIGRRKGMVIAGYAIASAVRPLLAVASAAWQVLGLRFIDRIGKGIRSAPRDALIADSIAAERRGLAFGFHRAMDHAGAIAGALASSWLIVQFAGDFRSVFWAAAAPAIIAVLILLIAVRDVSRRDEGSGSGGEGTANSISASPPVSPSPTPPVLPSPRPPVSSSLRPSVSSSPPLSLSVFDRNFKLYLAVLLIFALGNSSDAFLLLRAEQRGVGVAMIPVLWAALHVSKSLSSVIGGDLSDRFGRKRLIICGWIVYAAIYFGFAFAATQIEMWLLFVLYGVYFGLTEGVEKALVADLASADSRGAAFGIYNLVIGIGALPASLITGALWVKLGPGAALAAGAGLSLLASLLLAVAVDESRSPKFK
jgi:MFS family permease